MNDINDIRRQNARELAAHSGSLAAFADRIDRAATQVSRFMGANPTKPIGNKLARHIEECFKLEAGWLDTERSERTKNQEPPQNSINEDNALYMALSPETNQIQLLQSVIETIETILIEEDITLTPEEKASAIIACLQTCIKRGMEKATSPDIAATAIHAVS